MEVEVNGKTYEFIDPQPKNKSGSRYSGMALQMLAMMSIHYVKHSNKAPMPKYTLSEIVSEYALIENKKSNLPRAQREHVINQFKKHFQEIKDDGITQ